MIIRRAFYHWQFIAAGALPLWLLVGSSIFGSGAWAVLGIFFGAVLIGLGLLLVALVIFARKEVREMRAVSFADVGVLTLWHALIIAIPFSTDAAGWLSVLVIIGGLAVFWFAVWELFDAARRRVREMVDLVEQTARGPAAPTAPQHPLPHQNRPDRARPNQRRSAPPFGRDAPEVIVIEEKRDRP
ncbi:MFS transporter [Cryobacterium sp. PH29-G1]|uniref:MFS transporter n=1 Tax=Cryobacterium sp. PH29-G1 TaxID=3046211 RepID=UPI0024BB54A7|nr:MFS transporter [Cryobacterium sp. PH29-G1]MDJ0349199.1 MFS transporter [Cryobacterium sp. PH29-G1]